jgi:hypothetical protein
MLLTQKSIHTSLAILVLLISAKIVSACSVVSGATSPDVENYFYTKIYFFSSIFLILAIIVTYFLRGRKSDWLMHTTVMSIFVMIPLTFVSALIAQDCGDLVTTVLRYEFIFFLLLFVIQVISWIMQRSKLKTELP